MKWLHSRTAVVALVVAVTVLTIALGTWQGWLAEAQTVRWVNALPNPTTEPTECGTAYPDIASALAAAVDGDTVRLCEGTYGGNVNVNKEVTIEGREGAARADVVIEVASGAGATDGLNIQDSNVTIHHLKMDGPGAPGGGTPPTIAIDVPAGAPPRPEGIEISDVEITDWDSAIIAPDVKAMVIEESYIHGNHGVADDIVKLTGGEKNQVLNNEITGNGPGALVLDGEDEALVDRNKLADNDAAQVAITGDVNVRIWRNEIAPAAAGADGIVIAAVPADALVQIGGSPDNANTFGSNFNPATGFYLIQLACDAQNTVDAIYNYWGGGVARADVANRIFNDEDDVADAECPAAEHPKSAVVFHPWATAPAPTPSPSPTPTPTPSPTPTVTPTPSPTVTPSATRSTFDLVTGWNNFVWTGSDGTAAEAALACIAGKFAIAYEYDGAGWKSYVPGRCTEGLCTLTTVDQYDSLLVLVTASGVQCKDMPVASGS
ncbi:MAG: right-handed parallel beta-helix repeat-containing protein [Dehalococcoidia bacterium]|nr:right-handed parallel beta-helix repeat-containing protein [Dehalococcoidia bacterium]